MYSRRPYRRRTAAPPPNPPGPGGRAARPPPNPCKDLVPLNTAKLRNKALQGHRKAEQEVTRLKDQLKRYHEHDVPGFRSWIHANFGPLLTRQRELQQALEERRTWIRELMDVAERFNLGDVEAYRKWQWRRAHPQEAEAEDRQLEEARMKAEEAARQRQAQYRAKHGFPDPFEDSDAFPEEDDFDSIPDDQWDDFGDFFETLFGERPPSRGKGSPAQADTPDGKNAKDLYRTIVRKLHPDHHGQMSEARKALWHEAQDAYRRRDVNALHGILNRCEGGEAGLGNHSPLSLIQRLTLQLRQSAKALRGDIRRLRRDVAWDYETRRKSPQYVERVRSDLSTMIHDLEWSLGEIKGQLDYLERLANRPSAPARRRGRRPTVPPYLEDLF